MAVTYATITRAATGPTPKRTFAFHPMTDDEVVTIAAEDYEHVGPYEVTTGAGGTFSIDIPLGTDQGGAALVWKIVETPVDRIAGRGKGGLAPAVVGYATITASIGYDDLIAGLVDAIVVTPDLASGVADNAATATTKAAEASGYADVALGAAADAATDADLAEAARTDAESFANGFLAGTATALAPGASPTVSITGTAPTRQINLGIPAGLADDASMTAVADNAASAFRASLSATYVARVGLFSSLAATPPALASSVIFARSDGYTSGGVGGANYVYDAAVNSAYVTANPRTSFLAANGRGFRLVPSRVSAFMFGAVGDLVTDDTAALQAFATFVSNNDVGIADVGGQFLVADTVLFTHATLVQTRRYTGFLYLKAKAGTTGTSLLRLYNGHYTVWDTVEGLGTGNNGDYTTRTWQTVVYLEQSSAVSFRRLRGTLLSMAVGATSINSSKVDWGSVKATDVGSGARSGATRYGLTTMVSNITRTGVSTSVTQTSTIDVTTLPPSFYTDGVLYGGPDNAPFLIVLTLTSGATREFFIKSVDTVNSRLTVYPWVGTDTDTAVAADYLFGGSLYIRGNDANVHTWDQIDAIRCGTGVTAAGLYGPTAKRVITQNCGAGLLIGGDPGGAMRGLKIDGFYPENNVMDVLCVPRPASSNVTLEIGSDYALNPAKMRVVGNNRAADGTESTNYQAFVGARFSYNGKIYVGLKPPRNGVYANTTPTYEVTRPDQIDYFHGNTVTATYSLNADIHRMTGLDSARLTVVGTGTDGAPTGTVSFPAPSGYTINGGAGPVSFTGLTAMTEFVIRFDVVNANVVVTKVPAGAASSGPTILRAAKTANQIVNNSVTFVTDTELSVTVSASKKYAVEAYIPYAASTTADMNMRFSLPSGSIVWSAGALNTAATVSTSATARAVATATETVGGIGATTKADARPLGLLTVGVTGGTFAFQFAQNVAEATDATVYAGAWLKLTEI